MLCYKDKQQAEEEGEEGEGGRPFYRGWSARKTLRAFQQSSAEGSLVQRSCGRSVLGCQRPAAEKPIVLEENEQEGR